MLMITTDAQSKITGVIDGCCCKAEILKSKNVDLQNLLAKLSNTLFFKYFKLDLDSECTFWGQDPSQCKSKCSIKTCKEDEIPKCLIQKKTDLIVQSLFDFSKIEEEDQMNTNLWYPAAKDKDTYLNLQLNKESFTGYQRQKIWENIYKICLSDKDEECEDEKFFNKLISGLHSSISTHLSENYHDRKNRSNHNVNVYFEKVAHHPQRLENLYFVYSLFLRAVNIASSEINKMTIDTDNFKEDLQTKEILSLILNRTNEYCDFTIESRKENILPIRSKSKSNFQKSFYNISKLMDCVECEKCKVNGKVQFQGTAIALKILFSAVEGKIPSLQRNEIVALMNTFAKISNSLNIIEKMYERRMLYKKNILTTIAAVGMVFIFFMYIVLKTWEDLDGKLKRKFRIASYIQDQHLKTN